MRKQQAGAGLVGSLITYVVFSLAGGDPIVDFHWTWNWDSGNTVVTESVDIEPAIVQVPLPPPTQTIVIVECGCH